MIDLVELQICIQKNPQSYTKDFYQVVNEYILLSQISENNNLSLINLQFIVATCQHYKNLRTFKKSAIIDKNEEIINLQQVKNEIDTNYLKKPENLLSRNSDSQKIKFKKPETLSSRNSDFIEALKKHIESCDDPKYKKELLSFWVVLKYKRMISDRLFFEVIIKHGDLQRLISKICHLITHPKELFDMIIFYCYNGNDKQMCFCVYLVCFMYEKYGYLDCRRFLIEFFCGKTRITSQKVLSLPENHFKTQISIQPNTETNNTHTTKDISIKNRSKMGLDTFQKLNSSSNIDLGKNNNKKCTNTTSIHTDKCIEQKYFTDAQTTSLSKELLVFNCENNKELYSLDLQNHSNSYSETQYNESSTLKNSDLNLSSKLKQSSEFFSNDKSGTVVATESSAKDFSIEHVNDNYENIKVRNVIFLYIQNKLEFNKSKKPRILENLTPKEGKKILKRLSKNLKKEQRKNRIQVLLTINLIKKETGVDCDIKTSLYRMLDCKRDDIETLLNIFVENVDFDKVLLALFIRDFCSEYKDDQIICVGLNFLRQIFVYYRIKYGNEEDENRFRSIDASRINNNSASIVLDEENQLLRIDKFLGSDEFNESCFKEMDSQKNEPLQNAKIENNTISIFENPDTISKIVQKSDLNPKDTKTISKKIHKDPIILENSINKKNKNIRRKYATNLFSDIKISSKIKELHDWVIEKVSIFNKSKSQAINHAYRKLYNVLSSDLDDNEKITDTKVKLEKSVKIKNAKDGAKLRKEEIKQYRAEKRKNIKKKNKKKIKK